MPPSIDIYQILKHDPILHLIYTTASHLYTDAYIVGGLVRDLLSISCYPGDYSDMEDRNPPLTHPRYEYDLVVRGDSLRFCRALHDVIRGSLFPLDKERGVYRFIIKGEGVKGFDLDRIAPASLFKGALKEDGSIQIDISTMAGKDIHEDLSKRDFTIDAIAIPLLEIYKDGRLEFIDPFKGIGDIKKRSIRAVSSSIFDDDPLRLLRAVRIAALTGSTIEKEAEALIKEKAHLIQDVAGERIRDEFLAILDFHDSHREVTRLGDLGLINVLFSINDVRLNKKKYRALKEADSLIKGILTGGSRLSKGLLSHLATPVSGIHRYLLLKFAALLHALFLKEMSTGGGEEEIKPYISAIGKRFRLGNMARRLLFYLHVYHHDDLITGRTELSERMMAAFYRGLGTTGVDILLFALIDPSVTKDDNLISTIERLLDYYFDVYQKDPLPPLLKGEDIIKLFNPSEDKVIGEMLSLLNRAELKGWVKTREDAIELLNRSFHKN